MRPPLIANGRVIAQKRDRYAVKLINGFVVDATLSGRVRYQRADIADGDIVVVELDRTDIRYGKIVYCGE